MSRFLNGIKSFVHSISTNDHYASYDPSRPQGQEDTAPLATTHDERRSSSSSLGKNYVPGLRSAQLSSTNLARAGADGASSSAAGGRDNIPLNDMAPIPSAGLSWNRIDTWIEQNYPELYDQLLEGATANDLNDLEHDLDCALPQDVRESFEVHDGQEPGAKPTGVFFGIALLDLEGISEEWNVWRRAALKIDELAHRKRPTASSSAARPAPVGGNLAWIEQQKCCPPDTVQQVYAHPGWIPLAKDFDGNNIGVDLAPGPKGRYGQVILFGRDFDTKYVVAPSWGDFLAQFAADLESGQCFIDEDIENAVFAFKSNGQLVSYFNVLRRRVERTLPPRQPVVPQQQQQRRSMSNIASVSNAPVNSGRVTPRLISPTSSATSLPLKDNKPKVRQSSLAGQLNEIDLDKNDDESVGPDVRSEGSSEATKNEKPTNIPVTKGDTNVKASEKAAAAKPKASEPKPDEPKSDEPEPSKESSANTNESKEEAGEEEKDTKEAKESQNDVLAADDAQEEAESSEAAEELSTEAKTEPKPAGGAKKKNKKKKGKN